MNQKHLRFLGIVALLAGARFVGARQHRRGPRARGQGGK